MKETFLLFLYSVVQMYPSSGGIQIALLFLGGYIAALIIALMLWNDSMTTAPHKTKHLIEG